MNSGEQLAMIAAQRKERSIVILQNPSQYKICEGCGGLLFNNKNNHHCPFCSAYRFNYDHSDICAAARQLGDKPLADGCAVLPRLSATFNA
jgi:hypothetical protein